MTYNEYYNKVNKDEDLSLSKMIGFLLAATFMLFAPIGLIPSTILVICIYFINWGKIKNFIQIKRQEKRIFELMNQYK